MARFEDIFPSELQNLGIYQTNGKISQVNIITPTSQSVSGIDYAHYAGQGGTSPLAVALHDYTDSSRTIQLDKVGGEIGSGSYVLGLRRANNSTRRPDKGGTYVANCGFLQCTYDTFTQTAAVTGSIEGSVLNVSNVTSGALAVGQVIEGAGVLEGTTISSFGTGSGGVGSYNLLVRNATSAQTVASTALTGKTKSNVLAFYVGTNGGLGWSADRAIMTSGYNGGLYTFDFIASNTSQFVASFSSSGGQILNIQDAVSGTRTDIVAPSTQTSGIRIESLGGGIDLAGKAAAGSLMYPLTIRNGAKLPSYTVAALSAFSAITYAGTVVVCSNGDAGAECLAVASGGSWKRVPLGAAISAT